VESETRTSISLISFPFSLALTVSKAQRLRCPNPHRSWAVGYPRPSVASYALGHSSHISPKFLRAVRIGPKEYTHDPNFVDPISGGVVEVFRSIVDFHAGLAQIFRYAISSLGVGRY